MERCIAWACGAYTLLCQFATNSLEATVGDATLFAYGGRLILRGGIPYRDFWDNKPPGIFYLEALSYRLFGTTWLGPTVTQAAVNVATIMSFVWLSRKLAPDCRPQRVAFVALSTLLMNQPMFTMDGGNLTQNYILLPIALALGLMDPLGSRPHPVRWGLAGLLAGAAFLIRPNALSIGWLALTCLATRQPLFRALGSPALPSWPARECLRAALAFAVGTLLPLATTSAYFAWHGLLGEMWFATLTYNVTAYKEVFLNRPTLLDARRYFMFEPRFGVVALYASGLVAIALGALRGRAALESAFSLPVTLVAVAWVFGDLMLVIATGHPYPHYVSMLVPSAAFFASLPLREVSSKPHFSARWLTIAAWLPRAAAVYFLVLTLSPLVEPMPEQIRSGMRRSAAPFPSVDQEVALYVRSWLGPDEPVMTLGHFHGHMMYLGNPPAVPLLSTFHLKSNYGNARWTPQYLDALSSDQPPKVVVITDGYWNPSARRGPAPPRARARDRERPKIEKLIRERYSPARQRFAGRRVWVLRGVARNREQKPAKTKAQSWF